MRPANSLSMRFRCQGRAYSTGRTTRSTTPAFAPITTHCMASSLPIIQPVAWLSIVPREELVALLELRYGLVEKLAFEQAHALPVTRATSQSPALTAETVIACARSARTAHGQRRGGNAGSRVCPLTADSVETRGSPAVAQCIRRVSLR